MADPTETLPPRPDSFARELLAAQREQHAERMQASARLEAALSGRLDRLDSGQQRIETGQAGLGQQLATIQAGGLGSWERRGMLTGGLVVLLLLILLLAQSRGVDTGAAVDGVRQLSPLATGAATGVDISSPRPAASVSASPPTASPPAPASAPESHGDPSSAVGEPWHEGEGPTR